GAAGAGLTLLDSKTNSLVFRAAIGDGADGIIGYQVPLEGSQHGLAFATGEVQSSTPINTDIEDKAKVQFKNVLVAPLFINEDGVGTISAVNKQNGEHFTPDDMEAYRHFADLAAMVIRQRQREEILKDLMAGRANAVDELAGITFNEEDKQLMSIIQDVMKISQHQSDMLPMCKRITEMLAEMSTRNRWA
ncbi:MAG: GAF domain-containing protein, partial [Gammaproteobacteria bacterium]|nr:GAF domain-containing protein [Gammaproteobacteria bacterium]